MQLKYEEYANISEIEVIQNTEYAKLQTWSKQSTSGSEVTLAMFSRKFTCPNEGLKMIKLSKTAPNVYRKPEIVQQLFFGPRSDHSLRMSVTI